MQVNFTGIKNVGFNNDILYPTFEENGKVFYQSDVYADLNVINMQLNDDFNGKDLSEYKKSVCGASVENKTHPIIPGFIHLGVLKGEMPEDKDTYFFLNGSKLEVTDENMPIFSFLAKTLKKLAQQPLEKFVVNNDYLFGPDAAVSIKLGENMADEYDSDLDYFEEIAKVHNPEHVQNGAAKMLELLQNKIFEYLQI